MRMAIALRATGEGKRCAGFAIKIRSSLPAAGSAARRDRLQAFHACLTLISQHVKFKKMIPVIFFIWGILCPHPTAPVPIGNGPVVNSDTSGDIDSGGETGHTPPLPPPPPPPGTGH